MRNITAIITARGGSKRLPDKNLRLLNGIPLVAHTIMAALKSPSIERCFVTTDSERIKLISRKYGSEVLDRPPEFAQDKTSSEDTVRHSLSALGYKPEYFILLQPTSPLRTSKHIEECLKALFDSRCECAVSVKESDGGNNYIENGAIYIMKTDLFLERNSFYVSPLIPYPMSDEDSVDIDTIEDFERAEKILKMKEKLDK